MPSLKDIAAHAGTSVSTVSHVLNGRAAAVRISEATRDHVLASARELGYTPNVAARRLRAAGDGAHPLVIGVLMPFDERLAISAPLLAPIHQALDSWSRAEGRPAEVILETYAGVLLPEVRSLRDRTRYHGVIALNTMPHDDRALAASGPPPIPLVLVQRSIAGQSWVNTDNASMAGAVAAHLLALGHRRLAVVQPTVASAAQEARLLGFAERVRATTGRPLEPALVARGAFSEQGGYGATVGLLDRQRRRGEPPPTALFVTVDRMAVGALHALKAAGLRVPGDVAVVGFDDEPVAAFLDPPLTTVDSAVAASAAAATHLLLDLIHGRAPAPQTCLLEARLVVRASCGAGERAPIPAGEGRQ